MQAVYAFSQFENESIPVHEKELMKSIYKTEELFLYFLSSLLEIRHFAEKTLEEAKSKRLPTKEDLAPNLKFVQNKLLVYIEKNESVKKAITSNGIEWSEYADLMKKIYNSFKTSEAYIEYMNTPAGSFEEDRELVIRFYKSYLADEEMLLHRFEELNIHWSDDWYFINGYVLKYLKDVMPEHSPNRSLPGLFKDEEDDLEFVKILFRKTITNTKEYQDLIVNQAKNWEEDRIAVMDFILMKMAICELTEFPSIPVKVTLNEYIELSKNYSTPKSKVFINGILDKLVPALKREGKINKEGRGLVE
ncbi:MAG: transcription antitermination factor NusB [Bacteroidetes bacterium]|nr:transcription antitermination factor NusB [Bacteroidota bacterium]